MRRAARRLRRAVAREAAKGCVEAHVAFYGRSPFTEAQVRAYVARTLVVEEMRKAAEKWGPTEDGYPVDYLEKGDGQ